MKFKQWLLESEGSGSEGFADRDDDSGCDWDLIYPTTAGDYVYDIDNPKWFWWLQWRWKRGEEIGRELHNIDRDILKWRYTSPYSRDLPGNEWWHHKPDSGESSMGVAKNLDLVRIGVGDDYDKPLVMHGPRVVTHGMGDDPPPPPDSAAPPEITTDKC
tara:strand:+ start:2336 stop:2812 length:477 start_codon:yes stop_codon:yes gene_type:complete